MANLEESYTFVDPQHCAIPCSMAVAVQVPEGTEGTGIPGPGGGSMYVYCQVEGLAPGDMLFMGVGEPVGDMSVTDIVLNPGGAVTVAVKVVEAAL